MTRGRRDTAPSRALPLADELAVVFARMSGLLLSEETVATSLEPAELAGRTRPCPERPAPGSTMIEERGADGRPASTDARVAQADALQYELDEGPCLAAAATGELVRVDDLTTDPRWPRWARGRRAASGCGPRMSAPLVAGNTSWAR